MVLVYGCVAPHGGETIEQLASKSAAKKFRKTKQGMLKLAEEIKDARPDTIVIASPHNLRLWQKISVVTAENSSGRLQPSPRSEKSIHLRATCDVRFAKELLKKAHGKGLPVVGANYGAAEGASSDMPMDWGTFIPLWFFIKHNRIKPKIVIVTPSREIPLRQNFEFGRTIAQLAERSRKRFVFVASADQAHAHKKNGPYGFNRAAASYDNLVVEAIRTNRIDSILGFKRTLVEAAKPDSLWQIAILAGIASRVKMQAELLSYEVPTYFGMICAAFRRLD
jgi:aromatic ring-opening dioxygenase LigB subunit